jgi:hypothetical protein
MSRSKPGATRIFFGRLRDSPGYIIKRNAGAELGKRCLFFT